jgi:rhodanese-related sulfurtransferase
MGELTKDRKLERWRWHRTGALAAVFASAGLVAVGQPSVHDKVDWLAPELDRQLESREIQIDAAELVGLMHNNQVRLLLLDVRDEADFNLFHLLDARRITVDDLAGDLPRSLDPETIVVVMSNDERRATEAWRLARAQGLVNSYVLEEGINGWLERYGEHFEPRPTAVPTVAGADEPLRYSFPVAIGDRLDTAWPDPHRLDAEPYVAKVKVVKPISLEGGGCG